MKEKFQDRKLTGMIKISLNDKKSKKPPKPPWVASKAEVCAGIVAVVRKYQAQDYKLSLRQLYYQLVAADLIPNHDKVYKKLSGILDDLRYSGIIDWDAIEDRGRVPDIPYCVENVHDALEDAAKYYRLDRQNGQNTVVEVWTEKDAISGILKRITHRYHVQLIVNKGYSSSSAMYRAYTRFVDYINEGKKVVVLYFGDHDPSGLDMIRDIRERVEYFIATGDQFEQSTIDTWWEREGMNGGDVLQYAEENMPDKKAKSVRNVLWSDDCYESDYEVYQEAQRRLFLRENNSYTVVPIGLTMAQIKALKPPPNPAKLTDPRAKWYVKQFGNISWEVDAIEPRNMETIVEEAIIENIDHEVYEKVREIEQKERATIKRIALEYKDK